MHPKLNAGSVKEVLVIAFIFIADVDIHQPLTEISIVIRSFIAAGISGQHRVVTGHGTGTHRKDIVFMSRHGAVTFIDIHRVGAVEIPVPIEAIIIYA
jgi:hypothetical protein